LSLPLGPCRARSSRRTRERRQGLRVRCCLGVSLPPWCDSVAQSQRDYQLSTEPGDSSLVKRSDHTATVEISAGTAAARKMSRVDHLSAMNCPPSTGPTMAPARPMPRPQPTPVDRRYVG